jgi:hypothetical protein
MREPYRLWRLLAPRAFAETYHRQQERPTLERWKTASPIGRIVILLAYVRIGMGFDSRMECAPPGGQDQATDLTACWVC